MAHHATPPSPPVDERLETLLQIEQRLESRVRDAEEDARRRIAVAGAEAARVGDAESDALREAMQREEESDRARLLEELARVEAESAAAVERASRLSEGDVERLARGVYARVVGGEP